MTKDKSIPYERHLIVIFIISLLFPILGNAGCGSVAVPTDISSFTKLPAGAPKVDPPIVGGVVWLKGKFRAVSPDNSERVLAAHSPVYLHDYLITEKGAQGQVVFTDKSLMTFQESTQFYIKDYNYAPKANASDPGKFVVNLIVGGFRTITGLISKEPNHSYQVQTPVATIGVRGTDYAVYSCKKETFMNRYKGTPVITNEKGTIELSQTNPFGYVADANRPPVFVSQKPAVFAEPLPILPAVIKSVPVIDSRMNSDKSKQIIEIDTKNADRLNVETGTGTGSGACKIGGGGGGGFTIKTKQ